jgi:hypothetical protein
VSSGTLRASIASAAGSSSRATLARCRSAQFELGVPLAYIETTIPSGMTIDEYRCSRPQPRLKWAWLRHRGKGASGMPGKDYG